MNEKILRCLACLILLSGCGKTWRSKSHAEAAATKAPSGIEHWSGRADFTAGAWQINTPP